MWQWLIARWGRWRSMPETARTGRAGERLAKRFLKRDAGYSIVVCNWRSPRDRRDEIDIVCRDGEVLVFVEVKTRAAHALVSGYHAVNAAKRRVLLRACKAYLERLGRRRLPATYRFDVVEVEWSSEQEGRVHHFQNVPLFPKDYRF